MESPNVDGSFSSYRHTPARQFEMKAGSAEYWKKIGEKSVFCGTSRFEAIFRYVRALMCMSIKSADISCSVASVSRVLGWSGSSRSESLAYLLMAHLGNVQVESRFVAKCRPIGHSVCGFGHHRQEFTTNGQHSRLFPVRLPPKRNSPVKIASSFVVASPSMAATGQGHRHGIPHHRHFGSRG